MVYCYCYLYVCFHCSGRFSIVAFYWCRYAYGKRCCKRKIGSNVIWVCVIGMSLLISAIALLYNNVDNIGRSFDVQGGTTLFDRSDRFLFCFKIVQTSSTDRLLEMYEEDDINNIFG